MASGAVGSTRVTTPFPSAVRTTHVASPDQNANGSLSAVLDIDITQFTGTSITFTVLAKDPVAGTYYTVLASAALVATGHTVLIIDPRVVAAANLVAQRALPRQFRVLPSGTITTVTYSLSVTFND